MTDQPLEHRLPLKRFRLHCYAIENVLLTDACLETMGTTWDDFAAAAMKWIRENPAHPDAALVNDLATSDDRLRHKKIKKIRQLICAICNCRKPWEVVVGQAIGALTDQSLDNPNTLVEFLGVEMIRDVIFRQEA